MESSSRSIRLILQLAITVALLTGIALVAFRLMRGPVGASTAYGGQLEAEAVPPLPVDRAASWVGQAPARALPAKALLIEAWHPE